MIRPNNQSCYLYFKECTKDFGSYNVIENYGNMISHKKFLKDVDAIAGYLDKNNIKKIEVIQNPNKLTYTEGETIDISGLIIKLTDKNTNTIIVDYTNLNDYNIDYIPNTKLTNKDNVLTIKTSNIKTTIPMAKNTESLNLGVAGSILFYLTTQN